MGLLFAVKLVGQSAPVQPIAGAWGAEIRMLDHIHKCIFVHIPRTGGRAIERVFLNTVGLDWANREPLLLRNNDNPAVGPPRLAHLRAEEYVRFRYVPEDMFVQYFKFAIVRNPWDRLVAIYRYSGLSQFYPFRDFCLKVFARKLWRDQYWLVCPQVDYLCNRRGAILMDFVGRFEHLQDDFDQVCARLDIESRTLKHAAPGARRPASVLHPVKYAPLWVRLRARFRDYASADSYQAYYDADTRALVEERYGRDIEQFDYDFESGGGMAKPLNRGHEAIDLGAKPPKR